MTLVRSRQKVSTHALTMEHPRPVPHRPFSRVAGDVIHGRQASASDHAEKTGLFDGPRRIVRPAVPTLTMLTAAVRLSTRGPFAAEGPPGRLLT